MMRGTWRSNEALRLSKRAHIARPLGEGRTPTFLKINPAGKVPVLVDGHQTITESAAICLHIGEKYPDSGLLAAPATPERTECYRWISFVLSEMDAALWTIAKHRFALPKEKRVEAVLDTAEWEYTLAAKILSRVLEGRDYLAGDRFSLADIISGHTLMWARSARIAQEGQALTAYLQRLEQRPALQRAQAATTSPSCTSGP
jgi:glutathione S-transferase